MLQSTLLKIQSIASDDLLKEVDIDEFRKVFISYKKGMWIYPGFIIKKFHIKPKIAYEFLINLENANILKGYYELYCSHCQKSLRKKVETFKDVPETIICDYCNRELSGIESAIVIYKVISDE